MFVHEIKGAPSKAGDRIVDRRRFGFVVLRHTGRNHLADPLADPVDRRAVPARLLRRLPDRGVQTRQVTRQRVHLQRDAALRLVRGPQQVHGVRLGQDVLSSTEQSAVRALRRLQAVSSHLEPQRARLRRARPGLLDRQVLHQEPVDQPVGPVPDGGDTRVLVHAALTSPSSSFMTSTILSVIRWKTSSGTSPYQNAVMYTEPRSLLPSTTSWLLAPTSIRCSMLLSYTER
ncbi:MAG: hypothetical protein [Circular genetic element sp.]|nr:MAG: hypothetical protein [Circular genetic element sp.]